MLIIYHNCRQGYKNTVIALETTLSIKADIFIIQELFIGNREIAHNGFNIY